MKSNTKRLLWILGTMIPVYSMLIVFMPPGFGSVPWVVLVFFVFLVLFINLLIYERSWLWNGIIAFLFWVPMMILYLLSPGTENIENGTVYIGVLGIIMVALVHASMQMAACSLVNLVLKRTNRMDANVLHLHNNKSI